MLYQHHSPLFILIFSSGQKFIRAENIVISKTKTINSKNNNRHTDRRKRKAKQNECMPVVVMVILNVWSYHKLKRIENGISIRRPFMLNKVIVFISLHLRLFLAAVIATIAVILKSQSKSHLCMVSVFGCTLWHLWPKKYVYFFIDFKFIIGKYLLKCANLCKCSFFLVHIDQNSYSDESWPLLISTEIVCSFAIDDASQIAGEFLCIKLICNSVALFKAFPIYKAKESH